MTKYQSVYPPAFSSTYVRATSYYDIYYAHLCTDYSKSLIGTWDGTSWASQVTTNNRFHIDLGTSYIIRRVYYENSHSNGSNTDRGAKNFSFWGTNDYIAFTTVTYSNDTNWTQLSTDITQLAQHVASNVSDPQYIYVNNSTPYRYYSFKFANNWGGAYMSLRRVELQIGIDEGGSVAMLSDYGVL